MIDDISLRVMWDRLVSITNEASAVLKRSAFSSLVRDANDFACTIMTPVGDLLAIADASLPSFSATQPITLRACLDLMPLETWRPGDVIITNDPWISAGQIPDITLLRPVFFQERLIAFTGSLAHSPDVGGIQQWNAAKDVFEEGLFIPPIHLYREDTPNETLFEIIRSNTRMPDESLGDLMAQLSSHRVSSRRLCEVMSEHGLSDLEEVAETILARCEAAMRSAISDIPDGEYCFSASIDGTTGGPFGTSQDIPEPLEVRLRVCVADDELLADFSDSSLQVRQPINSVESFSYAYSSYALRLLLVPHLPHNAGFLRPITIKFQPGTVVSATFPAPTLSRAVAGHFVADMIFGALSEALPERARAMSGSNPVWVLILVGDDESGQSFQRILCLSGGLGASQGADGVVCHFPANIVSVPIEIIESITPLEYRSKELIPDSGGPGRYRGGLGVRSIITVHRQMLFSTIANRINYPASGFLGGHDGTTGRLILNGVELQPGAGGVLKAGDELIVETPGGGGLGAPSERPREKVCADYRSGLVSETDATGAYGCEV